MHRILALWAVPRSVSTAFERMMRERGDHEVFFEPFAPYYYFSADRRSHRFDGEVDPAPEHDFDAILFSLLDAAARRPIFVKEMASHVEARADQTFLDRFTSTFMIRHPRLTVASMAKIWPDLSLEEAGFQPQRRLFDRVTERTGRFPPVIDGEDLKTEPERTVRAWCEAVDLPYLEDALTWEPGRAQAWETWARWVGTVERTSGLPVGGRGSRRDPDEVVLADPRLKEVVAACLPHYEHLARHRL